MKEIGGYFELELNKGQEYHFRAIKLNLGRTALEYILRAKRIQKLWLPYYTCDVILEPITRMGVHYNFYFIDNNLEPVFDFGLLEDTDYFLYTNYYGLKDLYIEQLSKRVGNLIIDNAQSFFSKPLPGIDTFYSPRKFFGVPDGGYLYTNTILPDNFEIDNSMERFGHLIGRIEFGAEVSFSEFKKNEQQFCNQTIKYMSKITQCLLQNIDYECIAKIRKNNFQFLHEKLAAKNQLNIDLKNESIPMVYPYYSNDFGLRERLLKNKIFVATYWPTLLDTCDKNSVEYKISRQLIPLPIDQRYDVNDLSRLIQILI